MYRKPSQRLEEGSQRPEDRAAAVIEKVLNDVESGNFARADYSEYGILYRILTAMQDGGEREVTIAD